MMTKNLYFVFLFIWLSSVTNAQQKLDSLKNVLKTHQESDTARVKLYYNISTVYLTSDTEKGIQYADSALTLAKKLNDKKLQMLSLKVYGDNYQYDIQYKKSIEKYLAAAEIAKKINEPVWLGKIYHNIGLSYSYMGEYSKSIQYSNQSYQLFLLNNEKQLTLHSLTSLGANYLNLSDFNKSISYYYKSLKIAEELKDDQFVAYAYGNIAMVYKRMKNPERSFPFYEKAIEIFNQLKDYQNLANTYNNYGTAKDEGGQPNEAINLYRKALECVQKTNNKKLEQDIKMNQAIIYFDSRDFEKAVEIFKNTGSYYTKNNLIRELTIANQYYAKTILEAPDEILIKENISPKNRYRNAISLLNENLKYLNQTGSIYDLAVNQEILAEAYEKQGDYKNALLQFQNLVKLKDSIYNDENKEILLKREMEYQAEKKETLSKAEISKQKIIRNAVIIVGLISLIFILFLFLNFRKRQKIKQHQKELLLQKRISDTELKALRAQMSPHFIFNSLNSIADFVNKNDSKSANYYLAKFAKLMRGILESSEEQEVPLANELAVLENYIILEKVRLQNKFDYEVEVDENLNVENVLIPPLILQPFVENSIWHGFSGQCSNGKIKISAVKENDVLVLTITDNGIGRESSSQKTKKSYGIKITKERIDLLNKFKQENIGVFFTDLETGTRVDIKIPYEEL